MERTEIDTKFEIAEILVKHLDCDISKVLSPLYDYLQKQLILSGVVDTEGECCESGCCWKHSHTNWWQCTVCKDIQAR